MNTKNIFDQNSAQALWDKISTIKTAMLTTYDVQSGFHSRPMRSAQEQFKDSALYFFTSLNSEKIDEILEGSQVQLNYVDLVAECYVSVYGTAVITQDPEEIKKHYAPALDAYFKEGVQNPDLAMIRITVESAEYWDSNQNVIRRLYEMVRASVTNARPSLGEHAHLLIT